VGIRKVRFVQMADAAATSEPVHQVVCDRVRDMRKSRGWTLEQLASLSGVSRSMLSQIERGGANPTLGVAYRIAQAFGLSLGDLVDTPKPGPRIDVIRADDRSFLFRDDSLIRIRTLSPLHLEKDVEFYELTLRPGGVLTSSPHYEGTREFMTVEEGHVRVTSAAESVELRKGDSCHYPADVPHEIANLGESAAVAFLVDIYGRSSR
jgi:transcriptional regulator with XRE-family HTH domain